MTLLSVHHKLCTCPAVISSQLRVARRMRIPPPLAHFECSPNLLPVQLVTMSPLHHLSPPSELATLIADQQQRHYHSAGFCAQLAVVGGCRLGCFGRPRERDLGAARSHPIQPDNPFWFALVGFGCLVVYWARLWLFIRLCCFGRARERDLGQPGPIPSSLPAR